MLCRFGQVRPLVEPERDAGQEDAVEEALEDRRVAVVPDREVEHQRLGGAQAVDIGLNRLSADFEVLVVEPLLARQHRVEALGIEVAVVDVVAGGRKPSTMVR